MGAEPFASGDPAMLADLPDDLFGAVGSGPGEADFWTEADRKGHGGWAASVRPRRHRKTSAHAASVAPPPPAAPAAAKRTIRGRLAAAWAAETSARRALRYRPEGAPKEPGKGRKIAVGIVAVAALFAVGVAVADLLEHDRSNSEGADLESAAGLAPGSDSTSEEGPAADTERAAVESEIVDATTTPRRSSSTSPASTKKVTPSPTTPKSTSSASGSSGGSSPSASPSPARPATPTTAVPTTAAPKPVTPTTAVPATTAPPPAKPTVQAFTAKAAAAPGGTCSALQWATTLTWNTSSATSVAITGLLEQPLTALPGDGTKTICRALPGGPLGGWTLTATGPGGNTTATA